MLQKDVHAAGADHVHSGSRFVLGEYRFFGLVCADMHEMLENSQFLGCQVMEERNVLKDFAQRLNARAQTKDIGPDSIRSHRKANPSTSYLRALKLPVTTKPDQ